MESSRHLSSSQLAGFLDQDLDQAGRLEVEAHLDRCPSCRAELIELRSVIDTTPRATPAPQSRRRLSRLWWIPLATAAGIGGLVLVQSRGSGDVAVAPLERRSTPVGESSLGIQLVAPLEGAQVARNGAQFIWRARASDTYRVTLSSETGESLWSHETGDTSIVLPAHITVHAGTTYFWRVEAIADGIVASSGVQTVRIVP
jgi:hypothetical protein